MITPDTDTLKKKATKWLISDEPRDRESGRTYMLAGALFEKAKKCPGDPIYIFDHAWEGAGQIRRYIMEILKQHNTEYLEDLSWNVNAT